MNIIYTQIVKEICQEIMFEIFCDKLHRSYTCDTFSVENTQSTMVDQVRKSWYTGLIINRPPSHPLFEISETHLSCCCLRNK